MVIEIVLVNIINKMNHNQKYLFIASLNLPMKNVPLRMKTEDATPELTPSNLFEAMQNGLLLLEIHEMTADHVEQVTITRGVNKKPKSKSVMLKNLEIALRYYNLQVEVHQELLFLAHIF